VLRGVIDPPECPLFDASCSPATPVGACMVSSEGTCSAWFRQERWARRDHHVAGTRHPAARHGSGGRLTRELVREAFLPVLGNPFLATLTDAAVLPELPLAGRR